MHGRGAHRFVLELKKFSRREASSSLQASSSFLIRHAQFIHVTLGCESFVDIQVDAFIIFGVCPATRERHSPHTAWVLSQRHIKGTDAQDAGEAHLAWDFLLDACLFFESTDGNGRVATDRVVTGVTGGAVS
eukprot:scaffold2267_cov162-Amphora_coffeaeformis.AAC.1